MLFIAIGICAGVLAGMFGIGGGIIIVPALTLLAGMTFTKATGTSLAALLLPVGIFGVLHYYRSNQLSVSAAALIALGLVGGIWLGSIVATKIPANYVQKLFALFLVFIAFRLWFYAK
jgi:uncharacterized membrane protein YfcA